MDDWSDFNNNKHLVQGTHEWHHARKKRLGGSEIASVLGLSPYKSRRILWCEKTGRLEQEDISNKPHVKRGIDNEPVARALVEKIYKVELKTPTLIHSRWPFLSASLDGLCDEFVWENKCMGAEKHDDAKNGIIPIYYEVQCQWNMFFSGKDKCLFTSYRPEDKTLHEVWVPANKCRQREYLAKGIAFMRKVFRGVEVY